MTGSIRIFEKLNFTPKSSVFCFSQGQTSKYDRLAHRLGNLLFKKLWSSISKSLMLLFNTIANKQQFPSTWKVSEIVPIHKQNNKQVVSNYRPISLLNATSKVLEKLMFDKMYSKVQKLLHNSQHAFRTKRSTITNIILYLHEIYLM